MPSALLLAAEAGAGHSKTAFYVLAAALIVWALALAAIGISRHETFPSSRGLQRGLMLLTFLLVAGTMASAVITG